MDSADILKLVNAGYTKEEIEKMQSGQNQKQDQVQNQEVQQLREQVTETQKQLNQLVRQMQQNNLKTASVNILPEDDLMKKTDEAMAELIRPKYEKEEK